MKNRFLSNERLHIILNEIGKISICVVGDVCLDLYWYADMKRSELSRETPHYPLPVVKETVSPGAGGNVVNNVLALCPKDIITVSAVGSDWRAYLLRKWMRENSVSEDSLIIKQNGITPAFAKPMRMGISDVIYEDPRIDFGNTDVLSPDDEDKVIAKLIDASEKADIIAVCDQIPNGLITDRVIEVISTIGNKKPVVVDSRNRAGKFQNVIVKPNEVESADMMGADADSVDDYMSIASSIVKRNGKPAIVTIGSKGAIWCEKEPVYVDTVPAEPPIDIVGAGDTFLSGFICAYATGASGTESVAFANLASGVTVKKIGTTGAASGKEILEFYNSHYE